MVEMDKEELEEFVEEMKGYKARHTELITVYVPAGYNINQVSKQLESEKSTASNIKSKTTQKNVTDALESLIRHLKDVRKTPVNGLALFAGNVAEKEGQNDLQIWSVEPTQPLTVRLYRCDQSFVLEPLQEMLEVSEVYGLFVIERKEATIGLLEGKKVKILEKLSSGVPGKIRAGGQSSQRFHRITEGLAKEFYRRCAESLKSHFFNNKKLKGILIGGPMPTKEEFVKEGQLVTALREKIIGMKDIGYADEHGIEMLVEASQDVLAEQEIIHEKKVLEKFFDMLGKQKDKTAHGLEAVKKALEAGAVETLFVSKKFDKKVRRELEKKAKEISSNIEIISTDTQEGEQFWNLAKGVGAVLRFAIGE